MTNRPHSRQPAGAQAGMTLLEVLVSLLIFSFGFLGLIGMQARAVQLSTDAEDRSRAALLANDIVSTMWAQNTINLPLGTVNDWKMRMADQTVSGLPSSSGTVSYSATSAMTTVTITWHPASRKSTEADSKYVTQVMMP